MFNSSTLRGRVTLACAVTLVLALFVFAGGTLVTLDVVQHRLLDAELGAVANAQSSTVDISTDGTIDAPDRQRFDSVSGANVARAIVLPDRRILASSTSNTPRSIVQAAATANHPLTTTLVVGGEDVRAAFIPLSQIGRHVATIVTWSDDRAIATLDRNLAIVFALAIPLFGIATIVACNAIAGLVLAPLEQIIADASHIEEDGGPAGVTLPPTTELFRLACALNRMLARLRDAFERERRFTGDASHELRAPLAIIVAEADLALGAERSAVEYRRALETIAIEADGLQSLTRDLLATSRAEAAGSPSAQLVDLADVAASVLARVRILADGRNVALHSSLVANALTVGNTEQIEQAILTIVHNAVKYAAARVLVMVKLSASAEAIELSIADDGPGFSADALTHAFERFWHENQDAAESTGHGLGLAIARSTVKRYQGTIILGNPLEGGAVVTVTLPKSG